tara:strand:+ start:3349 stop:4986 length:1638 start_codon:yes stop_codon:yes gene_type:complete
MPDVQRSIEYVIGAKDNATKTFSLVGVGAAAMGAAVVAGLASSIKKAAEFEKQMSNISTLISGDSTEAMGRLKKGIMEMAQEIPVSQEDLGVAMYDVLSAGVAGAAEQMGVLEHSAKLAVAGIGTTQEAVDIMTSAINAFGLDSSDAESISDTLFKTVSAGKNTVSQLSQAFGATAPIVASAGFTLEDFSAAVATMTANGAPASQAQNSIRQAVVALQKPTKEMSQLFEKMGVKDLPEMVASGMSMGEIFRDLTIAADGNADTLGRAVGSVEAMNSVITVGEILNENYTATFGGMVEGAALVGEAFEKQAATAAANFQLMENSLDQLKIAIGDILLPYVIIAVQHITTTLNNIPLAFQLIQLNISAIIQNITANFTSFTTGVKLNFTVFKFELLEIWNNLMNQMKIAVLAPLAAVEQAFGDVFSWIEDKILFTIGKIGGLVDQVKSFVGIGRRSSGPTDSSIRRAGGGLINETSTLVGEHGPEIIQAPRGSRVTPAQDTRAALGGGGVNVTINIRGDLIGMSKGDLVDALGQQIMRTLRPHLDQA